MKTSRKLEPVEQDLNGQSIFCYMDNHIEENELKRIDYESNCFRLCCGETIPFEEIRFLIVRDPLFATLDEYLKESDKQARKSHYYQFTFNYTDGNIREGKCVQCKLTKGLWHVYRCHQGQIYYILIPDIHIESHKLRELSIPRFSQPEEVEKEDEITPISFDLAKVQLDEELLHTFSPEILQKYHAVPLYVRDNNLVVAIADPTDMDALQILSFVSGKTIEPVRAPQRKIDRSLSKWIYSKNENDALIELEEKGALNQPELTSNEIENLGKQKGVIRLMQSIIVEAISRGASDIHLHPRKDHLDLLLRLDGNLVPIRQINLSLHQALISRIKILGRMDISEHRLPQDGRIELRYGDSNIDMRISIMPTIFGESAVIRVLDSGKGLLSLDQLGFNDKDTEQLQHMLHASYGMVLVTGPTGSGKSTTLYAALTELINQGPHIITVEEPVEYQIDGVTQIPVNHKTGYTFARALRNILRHDPDIIMIGEIRDSETAKIAVESALTGHLVLSTLHTNSAASTITRLLEIGVHSYLLKDALVGVIAQRLVRKICTHCKQEAVVKSAILEVIGAGQDETFFEGKGCKSCHGTGVSGRMAVYEMLVMSSAIKQAISDNKSALELEDISMNEGMILLGKRALELARQGLISADEVYRVRSN
ncbi:GspE/PulE family protein [Aliikangiella sp. G2MR2-5]|uniref:GspE/PulE family protein n=1 Tax=Aliikangiella sp. G2MR2-5 TaxID=2788943 RepID=UPI0018A88CE9|nr:GspE/PulE family protein [Aliikangiella sp. G2MR2-5]